MDRRVGDHGSPLTGEAHGNTTQPGSPGDLLGSANPASTQPVATRVAEGDSPEILEQVWSQGCAAAVWRRMLRRPNQAWIDSLRPDQLPKLRISVRPAEVRRTLDVLFDQQGVPDGASRAFLADDIAALASAFARLMRTPTVRLRLDVINDNACRKFHLDNVRARLLCTYRGHGTEYGLANGQADPEPIHAVGTGSVGLFRGLVWPAAETSGIVHRSPPISGRGETRLLLVIDDGAEETDCA